MAKNTYSGIIVLLMEDDVFLANIYKTKFEMEGFKIVHSDNGEKGLEEARKKKPSIILLDILMPKMDGFSVLRQLREDEKTKKIYLDSYGMTLDPEELRLGQAFFYLNQAYHRHRWNYMVEAEISINKFLNLWPK